jgi:Zn-dependent protease with chaperone function
MSDTHDDAIEFDPASRAALLFAPLDEHGPDFRQPNATPVYVFGLALVTVAVLSLIAVYLSLIAVIATLLVTCSVSGRSLFSQPGSLLFHALLYVGPLLVGTIFLFFLLKPFFARRTEDESRYSLNHADAPLLFRLIGKICTLTGAPLPSRVDVNCAVNASASFRTGIQSLFGHDLVLTIGLPLVAGLNMCEFAGVLAHELGHFRQGAGMRLTYLIRGVNLWFSRVVYERDVWDLRLENLARSDDWRYVPVVQCVRACIWITRRILWLFMHLSHAISCFMLREMERNADRWERYLAGWDAFESTVRSLHLLHVASQLAQLDLRETWKTKRLPNHLPAYILHKQQAFDAEFLQSLDAARASRKTRWFDTHPSSADRVAAAHAGGEPGIFRWTSPASELFHDFDALSRSATRFFYERELELQLGEQSLVEHEQTVRELAQADEADEAMKRFFGNAFTTLRPVLIMTHETQPGHCDSRHILVESRARMNDSLGYAEQLIEEFSKLDRQIVLWTKAGYLLQGGFAFEPKEYFLTEASHAVATRTKNAAVARQKQLARDLECFEDAARSRLCSALQLVPELSIAGSVPAEYAQEIPLLIKVLSRFGEFHGSLLAMRGKLEGFNVVLVNALDHPSSERVSRFLTSLANELSETSRTIRDRCRDLPYPFPHARGQVSVAEYSRPDTSTSDYFSGVLLNGSALVDRMFSLHYRVVSRLVNIAEAVEAALGLNN